MTPIELMDKLESLRAELSSANEEYKALYLEYIEKYNTYKVEYAKKYLLNKTEMGKATVNELESKTILDTQKEKLEADIAEAMLKTCRERIDSLKIEIDTVRSMLSYLKSEYERVE